MRKRKFVRKALSLALSLTMVFSLVPTATFNTALAESMGNMTSVPAGSSGLGPGDYKWQGAHDVDKRYGYKISVWYAPTVGEDENKNPIYGWGTGQEIQLGNTIYWTRNEISYEHPDGTVTGHSPAFWSMQSIYDQMTFGEGYKDTRMGNFSYYITRPLVEYGGWGSNDDEVYNSIYSGKEGFEGLNAIHDKYAAKLDEMKEKGLENTEGWKALNDYVWRLQAYPMTSEGFRVPLPSTADEYGRGGSMFQSGDDIKSYFLNPLVLNEISYSSGGGWSYEDFITGSYNSGDVSYENGQYKVYLEFVQFRYYNGQPGVLSFRDAMYLKQAGKANPIDAEIAFTRVSNGLRLEPGTIEVTLVNNSEGDYKGKGQALGAPWGAPTMDVYPQSDTDLINGYATDFSNAFGIGVLTSPSLNDYDPPEPENTPIIIKNYVKVTGVDKEGHVKFETVKEAVSEGAEFKVAHNEEDAKDLGVDNGAQSRVPSNLEDSESIMIDGTICTAYLNDIITVNRNVEMTSDMKWEGEVPESSTLQIEKSAKDIVGYKLGKRIYNAIDVKKFLQDVIERQNLSISIPADADQLDLEAIFQRILGDLTEAQRKAALEAYLIDYDVEAALNAAGVEVYETAEIVDESEIHIDTLTTVEGVGIEAQEYKTENDIRLGKTDENGKTVKYEDDELGEGVANPATLIARYVVVPNAMQYNVIEVVNKDTNEVRYYQGGESQIGYDSTDVEIKEPEIDDGIRSLGELVQIGWVTSSKVPPETEKFYEEGKLPDGESESKRGTSEKEIKEYPQSPSVHNLYVKWRIEYGSDKGKSDGSQLRVPEWRLSKYFPAYLEDGSDTHKKI